MKVVRSIWGYGLSARKERFVFRTNDWDEMLERVFHGFDILLQGRSFDHPEVALRFKTTPREVDVMERILGNIP